MRVTVTVVQQGGERQDVVIAADDGPPPAMSRQRWAGPRAPEQQPGHGEPGASRRHRSPLPEHARTTAGTPRCGPDGSGLRPAGTGRHRTARRHARHRGRLHRPASCARASRRAATSCGCARGRRPAGWPARASVRRPSAPASAARSPCGPALPATVAPRVSVRPTGGSTPCRRRRARARRWRASRSTGSGLAAAGARSGRATRVLVLTWPSTPDAHLSLMGEGGLAYNRPPRLSPLRPRPRSWCPSAARPGGARQVPVLMAFMPLVFGLAMYSWPSRSTCCCSAR